MNIAVLDSNIVFRRPEILSRRIKGIDLVVPKPVVDELSFLGSKRKNLAGIPSLLEQAAKKRIIRIDAAPSSYTASAVTHEITLGDALILTYLDYRKSEGDDLLFVTDDLKLAHCAAQIGVAVATSSSFPPEGAEFESPDSGLKKITDTMRRYEWIRLLMSVAIGVVASSGSSYLLPPLLKVAAAWHVWAPVAVILLLGPLVYAVRGRYRLFYGIAEFLVGVIMGARVFWPALDVDQLKASDTLQILAGIYVMVRGLENIGKALSGSRFDSAWSKFEGR
jgi:rRNA-processing protein FCF1